jgi:hypothetical protein
MKLLILRLLINAIDFINKLEWEKTKIITLIRGKN